MKIFLVIPVALWVTLTVNAHADTFPEVAPPSLAELKSLEPVEIVKDEYETTEEFERRKAASLSVPGRSISFFAELALSYDADSQAYRIKNCFDGKVLDMTTTTSHSGKNAMGAAWSWSQITGSKYLVDTGYCGKDLVVPYELSLAKLIRASVKAIARISVHSQKPEYEKNYDIPKFGNYVVFQDSSYTFRGQIDQVYVGTTEVGVVGSLDLAEIRAEKARQREIAAEKAKEVAKLRAEERRIREENARKNVATTNKELEKFGLSCDVPPSELYRAIDDALARGKSDLVKLLQSCP